MEIHWKSPRGQSSRFNLGFGRIITFVDGVADIDAELAQEVLIVHADLIGSGQPGIASAPRTPVKPLTPPSPSTLDTPAVTPTEGSEE